MENKVSVMQKDFFLPHYLVFVTRKVLSYLCF